MEKFDPEINIGEIIASRIRGYPFLEKEPKVTKRARKKPKKTPPCWIICPHFTVKPLRLVVTKEELETEYSFKVKIYAESRVLRDEALVHMITCGKEEIEAGNKFIWLNGYKQSIQRQAFWEAELVYFFRVKQCPEENFVQEVK